MAKVGPPCLSSAGVEIIDETGGGPGVRLRKPPQGKQRKRPEKFAAGLVRREYFLPMLVEMSQCFAYAEAYSMRLQ